MPVVAEKPVGNRSILASTGNRLRIMEEQRRKKEMVKNSGDKAKKVNSHSTEKPAVAAATVVRTNASADSSLDSSSSSSSGSNIKSGKILGSRRLKNTDGVVKAEKVASDEATALSPIVFFPAKRCDWITPNSEPLYTSFHDEEWGVPVHDDTKLYEFLVLSQALAELSWPVILSKRAMFRKLLHDFVPTSVANLNVENFLSTRIHGSTLLSEPKLRAIIENAKLVVKIQQDFESFSNYCWRFVNHKPIKTGFRHARQVPAKTPKAELMSKDLIQRGFRCVGPTVVYSFMQVGGLVNDHLTTCFRYNECSYGADNHPRPPHGDTGTQQDAPPEKNTKKTCTSDASCPAS